MNELNDTELRRIRLRFIDLIKSFLVGEPDAEMLSRWRGTFSALTKEQITPMVDQAVRELSSQLTAKKLEDLQDEYYALFTDPFGENHFNLMASHYIDGRNQGETLIAFRQFLYDAELSKVKSVVDSEDSLPVMLDVLASLIENEKNGNNTHILQGQLVNNFLLPFIDRLNSAMGDNQAAEFYSACIAFCKSYLDLEKGLTEQPS